MNPDSEDVRVTGNTAKYTNCPVQLEDWCLPDYVSQLDMRTKKFVTAIDAEKHMTMNKFSLMAMTVLHKEQNLTIYFQFI